MAGKNRVARGRAQRGAAFFEGVILVVFMLIPFAGLQYLARYFDSKEEALLTARRCAWLFSKNACDKDAPLPAVCSGVVGASQDDPNRDRAEKVQQKADSQTTPASNEKAAGLSGSIKALVSPMIEKLVGQSFTAKDSEAISRTPITASAPDSIAAHYFLPCNLKAEKPIDVIMKLWKGLISIP